MNTEAIANIIVILALNNLLSFAFIYLLISRLLGHRLFEPKAEAPKSYFGEPKARSAILDHAPSRP